MNNNIKQFLIVVFGYFIIYGSLSITGIKLTWWQYLAIIVGSTIISRANTLFPGEHD